MLFFVSMTKSYKAFCVIIDVIKRRFKTMKKRLLSILLIISALFVLVACENEAQTLPDLTGLNKAQAVGLLSSYDISVSLNDVGTNAVAEGLFVSYEGYDVGDEITPGMSVVVNFAVHINQLPDLTGKTETQIYSALASLNVIVGVEIYETNDVAEGLFVSYAGGYEVGDIVPDGTTITVYIATELIIVNRGVMISKYVEGQTTNKGIELYNLTSTDIDLSLYYLAIYENNATSPTIEIPLFGTIQANSTYLFANPGSEAELLALADQTLNNLTFDGNDVIALMYYNDDMVDLFGRIGTTLTGAFSNRTMVRDESITEPSTTFSTSEWNVYVADYLEPLGSHPVAYPTTFTYDEADTLIPYDINHPRGMMLVTYVYNYDGDTATFAELTDASVRFVGIDTDEIGSGPLATNAKNYLGGLLANAEEIYVQYDPSTGFRENYGRYLGLVWADGQLTNYLLVLHGHSQNNYYDVDLNFVYEGVSLNQWFENAETYAQNNNLGIWA